MRQIFLSPTSGVVTTVIIMASNITATLYSSRIRMSLLITGLTLDNKTARLRCVKKQEQSGTNCDVSNSIKCLPKTTFLRPL